jgi:hypothetical protein
MGSFQDALHEDKEMRERFCGYIFAEGEVTDFETFDDALNRAFDVDNLKFAKAEFNPDDIKFLFESQEAQSKLRQNTTEDEFNRAFEVFRKQEVIRKTPVGEPSRKGQVTTMVITIEKPIKIEESYTRTVRGKKISVKPYQKSYSKWTNAQVRFLQVRKVAGIKSIKEVEYEFSQQFKNAKTGSSIKTKFYRI